MERLDSILREHTTATTETKDKLLGASFVVVSKDGTLYSGSSGRIGMDTAAPEWTTESFSWVASMTKLVTIVAIMQLAEQGRVKLEDDMRELVPQLGEMRILRGFDGDTPILEDNTKPITLFNLLTHTAGLGIDTADPDLAKWSKVTGRRATLMDWTLDGFNTPLKFAPGEGWYYGTATDWAGQALEKITCEALGPYIQSHIFDPLRMRDSTFRPDTLPSVQTRTVEYTYRQEDGRLAPGPVPVPREYPVESGGGGLFTTAADFGLFLRGFLAGKLVGEETMERMLTPQLDGPQEDMINLIGSSIRDAFMPEFPPGLRISHGIGGVINLEDSPGKRRKGSMMWSGACNGRWWLDPTTGIAAVLFVNVQPHGDPVVNSLYNQLEAAVYGELLAGREQ